MKTSCNARPDHTIGSEANIPQSSARVRFAPESSNRSRAPPFAPATARVELIDRVLPSDDLVLKPQPSCSRQAQFPSRRAVKGLFTVGRVDRSPHDDSIGGIAPVRLSILSQNSPELRLCSPPVALICYGRNPA